MDNPDWDKWRDSKVGRVCRTGQVSAQALEDRLQTAFQAGQIAELRRGRDRIQDVIDGKEPHEEDSEDQNRG